MRKQKEVEIEIKKLKLECSNIVMVGKKQELDSRGSDKKDKPRLRDDSAITSPVLATSKPLRRWEVINNECVTFIRCFRNTNGR